MIAEEDKACENRRPAMGDITDVCAIGSAGGAKSVVQAARRD